MIKFLPIQKTALLDEPVLCFNFTRPLTWNTETEQFIIWIQSNNSVLKKIFKSVPNSSVYNKVNQFSSGVVQTMTSSVQIKSNQFIIDEIILFQQTDLFWNKLIWTEERLRQLIHDNRLTKKHLILIKTCLRQETEAYNSNWSPYELR